MLPKPVSSARYYHRSLNPKKLIQCGFSSLGNNMTMARKIKLLKVEPSKVKGVRAMRAGDVDAVATLLNAYLERFNLTNTWSNDEVAHWLLVMNGVLSLLWMFSNNSFLRTHASLVPM